MEKFRYNKPGQGYESLEAGTRASKSQIFKSADTGAQHVIYTGSFRDLALLFFSRVHWFL